MSVNTAHANGGVLIYNGEVILLYCDGVELSIEGISSKEFAGTKKGRIYLTTHRMIFLNKTEKDNLQSFSFPFFSLSGLELEQPIFGANYIKGTVTAQNGGNWTGKATFKLKFFSGGAIEFGQAMLTAARMDIQGSHVLFTSDCLSRTVTEAASQYAPPQPPPYTPYQGPYHPAPPPAYFAPAGGINGFVPPTHVFPDQPPANSVYMTDMPPPYPGIMPYAYPPGTNMYPQAGPNGYAGPPAGGPPPPAGPPPPGFNSPGAIPAAGAQPPPPYNPNYAPGMTAQYNGMAQQPPQNNETKSGFPPMYNFYMDPRNQQQGYANLPGNPYHQEPPPPYYEEKKKDQ